MPEAYIVDAIRTPVGRRNGGLSTVHPADLGAHVLREIVERNDLDPLAVEDVVFGCLDAIGPQAGDIARTCWLAAGLPEEVPGTTIDRQCGSSQQAVHFAAQGVMSGTQDVVIAGGVQNMSLIPISSAMTVAEQFGFTDPFSTSKGWVERYGTQEVSQFRGAELIAEKWDISREDMEAFAVESHERALRAQKEGRFDREIVPLDGVSLDEGPREPNWEKIRQLKPLVEGGRLTAALSSQLSDAAAAMLVVSERALEQHNLTPRARIHHLSVRGADPIFMLSAPIPATAYALEKTGMTLDQIDLVEINEAFASVVLAWQKETGADLAQGERERWRDRTWPSARRHGRAADDHAAQRARAHWRPLRAADDVRGRRPGQRHDHRAAVAAVASMSAPELEWTVPTVADVPAWTELFAAVEAEDRLGEVLGEEDVGSVLGLSYFDAARDGRLLWSPEGELVASGTVVCFPSTRHRRIGLSGTVRPSWRGRGVGTALVTWQIERGLELAAESAAVSPLEAWLEVEAPEEDAVRNELFTEHGFSPLRYYLEMRRPLAEPIIDVAVPGGLSLVPVRRGSRRRRARRPQRGVPRSLGLDRARRGDLGDVGQWSPRLPTRPLVHRLRRR